MTFTVTVTTTYDITQQQVADLVVTALEGGSNYWLGKIDPPFKTHTDYSEADKYGEDMITRTISADEDDDTYEFHPEAIRRGLQAMADQYPTDFNDLRGDNADAYTADVFMQCALLGDVIYG